MKRAVFQVDLVTVAARELIHQTIENVILTVSRYYCFPKITVPLLRWLIRGAWNCAAFGNNASDILFLD